MNVLKLFLLLKLVCLTQIKDVTSTLQKVNIKEQIFISRDQLFLSQKKPQRNRFPKTLGADS